MKKLFDKVKSIFFKKDFFIFLAIGVINTFNGTLFSMIFSKIFQPNVAFVFGYIVGLIISYILNSIFTFKAKLAWMKFLKFCVSCVPNFLIQILSVFIIYNLLGFDKLIAYLAAAVIGLPVTFLLLKFFTFAKKKIKK